MKPECVRAIPAVRPTARKGFSVGKGFSLVEVVMAVGIVSFALVVLLGMFGSLMNNRGEVSDREAVQTSVGALQSYLDGEADFAAVYEWVQGGTKELVFSQQRIDSSGTPSASGERLRTTWKELEEVDAGLLAAHEGRWIKAELSWDESPGINPMNVEDFPASPENYPHARMTVKAKFYTVPEPDFEITDEMFPFASVAMTVTR